MIDFHLFHFASAPRTATTWIRKASVLAGLPEQGRVNVHVPHNRQDNQPLCISCVRHPKNWLPSYFSAIYPGRCGIPTIDKFHSWYPVSDSFDSFTQRYLLYSPGAIGDAMLSYQADVFLRVEDLPWAFITLLESLGVPKRLYQRCLSLGKQNITKQEKLPRWKPHLFRQMMEAEEAFCERFDYV